MDHTITRSHGHAIAGTPYRAGGGYSGATDELDAAVQQAAQLLAEAFHSKVQIRFNSDRQSGGAWLDDGVQGFGGSCQIGLTARLCKGEITIHSYAKHGSVRDGVLNRGNPDSRYAYYEHPTLELSLAWLIQGTA